MSRVAMPEILNCVCGRSPYVIQRANHKSWAIGCKTCRIRTMKRRSRKRATEDWNNGRAWIVYE
jgi:hypothetical protein